MRTTRLVTRGKYIVPDKRGNRVSVKDTPNGSFDKPFPGGSVDVLVGKVCDMAHGKFRAGRHR